MRCGSILLMKKTNSQHFTRFLLAKIYAESLEDELSPKAMMTATERRRNKIRGLGEHQNLRVIAPSTPVGVR